MSQASYKSVGLRAKSRADILDVDDDCETGADFNSGAAGLVSERASRCTKVRETMKERTGENFTGPATRHNSDSKNLKSVMKDRSPSPKNGLRNSRKVTFLVEPIFENVDYYARLRHQTRLSPEATASLHVPNETAASKIGGISMEDYKFWKLERQKIEKRIKDVMTKTKQTQHLRPRDKLEDFLQSRLTIRRNSAPSKWAALFLANLL